MKTERFRVPDTPLAVSSDTAVTRLFSLALTARRLRGGYVVGFGRRIVRNIRREISGHADAPNSQQDRQTQRDPEQLQFPLVEIEHESPESSPHGAYGASPISEDHNSRETKKFRR